MASYNGALNGMAHCSSSLAATSGDSLGPLTPREDSFKSQFKTREGTYRNMIDAEHRPARTPGYSGGSGNPPVRVTFVTMPDPLDPIIGRDRICFNVGREVFVCEHLGLKSPPDTKNPVDKRVYKGTFPTCHDFNSLTISVDRVLLVIGFSAGQIQLVDPIKKTNSEFQRNSLFNEDRLIDRTKINSIKWAPGSLNVFIAAHASGHMYVYKDDLPCGQTPPVYQTFKQGDGFTVFTCKAKSTRNPLYKWTIGEGSLNEISFSPCSKFMATVSQDGFLRIFSYDTMDLMGRMRSYFGGLLCAAWSPDSKFIAVGGEDDLISVWSMNQKRVVARGQGHKSWVSVIAFDPYCTMYRDSDDGADASDEEAANVHSESLSPSITDATHRTSSAVSPPSEALLVSSSDSRQITSYRIGSVGQDTHLCLWDLTDDVLRQPVGRSRTSILLHSPAQETAPSLLNSSGNSASGLNDSTKIVTNGPVEGSSGTLKVKNKDKRNFTLVGGSKNSDKNGVTKSNQSKTDDPNKLLGTPACPRIEEVPMLEPLICKKISHERLTALVFREDSFVIACQEGFISNWARPAYGQLMMSPAQSIVDEEELGMEATNTIV